MPGLDCALLAENRGLHFPYCRIYFVSSCNRLCPKVRGCYFKLFTASSIDTKREFLLRRIDRGEKMKVKSFVQFGMNEAWLWQYEKMFAEKCPKYGIKFIKPVTYEWGAVDFHPQLDKLKALDPDFIYTQFFIDTDLVIAIQQLLEQGEIKCPCCQANGQPQFNYLLPDKTRKLLAKLGARNGFYGWEHVGEWVYDPNGPNKKLKDRYKAKYGEYMGVFPSGGYDEVMIIAKAMEKAGTTDPEKVRKTLLNMTYNGVTIKNGKFFPNGQLAITEYITAYNLNGSGKAEYIAAYPLNWNAKTGKTYILPFKR